jgi:chromosome segregation ATPase
VLSLQLQPCRLEAALRKQAAEVEQQSREWAAREAELAAAQGRGAGAAAAAQAELAEVQGELGAAAKRVRALEGENGELRKQRSAAAADLRMVRELLADSEAERR